MLDHSPDEVYTRYLMPMTVEAILSEVRQLAPDERARLQAALLQEQHDGTDDYLPVAPEVRQMLRGKTGADFTAAPRYNRDETLAWLDALLHEAADPEAEAEGADWDEVLRNIDTARHASRLLFPELRNESV